MDKTEIIGLNKAINKTQPITDALIRKIASGGPALVAVINAADTRIIFVNSTFTKSLGYANDDLDTGLLFTDLLEDYLRDRFLFQLQLISGDVAARSRYVIFKIRNKSGKSNPYYFYATPEEDRYHIVMHQDISNWDLPFTSFSTRELFLQQFNSEDFGTFEWIIDIDKIFWSLGLYRIYEVDDNEHKINNQFMIAFIYPHGDSERVKNEIEQAIKSGKDLNIEFRIVTVSHKIKILHCLGRAIRDDQGKPVKFAGSIRDITSQRSIEDELRNKVEQLNHSNRELEEFAYVASHDMQEPLRKITTFSDRLSEKYKDVLTGEGLMYLSRMIASAENMRTLINDLLDFSRITKTEQPFEPVKLDFVLRQVKTELELTIEETGTMIHSGSLPVVDAISSQMKQLFTNLIGNAIKFHKPGIAPVITIESMVLDEKDKRDFELPSNYVYYKIMISDNGIGFEEEYTSRIFQVFQRLHGKSEYPGSGIGLAICKKILEYHNGVIFAQNIPQIGARFTFVLPQRQQKIKL